MYAIRSYYAYGVFFAEAIGGALLVLGAYTRWVVLTLLPVLISYNFV